MSKIDSRLAKRLNGEYCYGNVSNNIINSSNNSIRYSPFGSRNSISEKLVKRINNRVW